jgi:hypothetical protein
MKKTINVSNETKLKSIIESFSKDENFIEESEDQMCYTIIFKNRIYTKNFNLLKKINNEFFIFISNNDNLYLTIYK